MRLTKGIRKLLERDPCQLLFNQLELVQEEATFKHVRQAMRKTRPRVDTGWVHATDSTLECDRLIAAALLGIRPPRSPIPSKTQRIFDTGTHMHLRYQSYFLCLPPPFEIEVAKVLRYWPLIGEADVTVQHPEIGKWIVELKTMNNMQWRSLSAPLPQHKHQLNCYLSMKGGDWGGQFWYENKNTQEVKLFPMEFDRIMWRETWLRVSDVANRLIQGSLPDVCPTCPDVEFCEDEIKVTPARIRRLLSERRQSYPE